MRTEVSLPACAVCLALGMIAVSPLAAKPPPIKIDPASLSGGLTASDEKQINARIAFWCETIAAAGDQAALQEAREGLLGDFRRYRSGNYRNTFARFAAVLMPPALDKLQGKDSLKRLQEIHLAIAISRMSQRTIQPALDVLVAHRNPGVRLLGWRGYVAIRPQVLLKSSAIEAMFASIAKHAKSESVPLVAAQLFEALHLPLAAPAGVEKDVYSKAQGQALEILRAALPLQCAHLAGGDAGFARPCEAALSALQTYGRVYTGQRSIEDSILQHVVDIASAAAKAYEQAAGKGPTAKTCAGLLIKTEWALSKTSGISERFLQKPLTNRRMSAGEKVPAVLLGIHNWIDRLKDRGVSKPEFKPPKGTAGAAATTEPATKPATKPGESGG